MTLDSRTNVEPNSLAASTSAKSSSRRRPLQAPTLSHDDFGQSAPMQQPTVQAAQHQSSANKPVLGNKDLIVRMFAEVFLVIQDENGHIKWHQVSSSLVPISLYSRTTNKWLDYLYSASVIEATNNPVNAMSPDSRDFLLLLQQFHHQNKPSSLASNTNRQGSQGAITRSDDTQNDFIIFQVVAHDYVDYKFKRILNVKVVQPGTRLGQASDYFVYWKTQAIDINSSQSRNSLKFPFIQSSSSFASNNPHLAQSCQTNFSHNQENYPNRQSAESLTWGLNFASINDAKLFYNICSLNLVNLNFDTEYLRRSTLQQTDRPILRTITNLNDTLTPKSMAIINQQRTLQQMFAQREQMLNQQRTSRRAQFKQQTQQNEKQVKRQASTTKCQSCKKMYDHTSWGQQQQCSNSNQEQSDLGSPCPVHGLKGQSSSMRLRSRSTTRQPNEKSAGNQVDLEKVGRARSFSTPASPECPVHKRRRRAANSELGNAGAERPQHLASCTNHFHTRQQSVQDYKPPKPARGFFRDPIMRQTQQQTQFSQLANQSNYQREEVDAHHANYSHEAGFQHHVYKSKPSSSYIDGNQKPNNDSYGQAQLRQFSDGKQVWNNQSLASAGWPIAIVQNPHRELDSLETIAHRDARFARALYANSKNLKEFLSLDAGGLNCSPARARPFASRVRGDRTKTNETSKDVFGSNPNKSNQNSKEKFSIRAPGEHHSKNSAEIAEQGGKQRATGISLQIDATPGENTKLSTEPARNASTTTEDLPLSSRMKERMFKALSEEEKEVQQEMGSRLDKDSLPQNGSHVDKLTQSSRTASLAPEVVPEASCVRSDIGRRRSLERMMCVDLDNSPAAARPKGSNVLSPVCQSTSPNRKFDLDHQTSAIASEPDPIYSNSNSANLLEKQPGGRFCEMDSRANLQSERFSLVDRGNFNRADCVEQLAGDMEFYQEYDVGEQSDNLLAAKSAPNICLTEQLRANQSIGLKSVDFLNQKDSYAQASSTLGFSIPRTHEIAPKRNANMSTYAVPLCSSERVPQTRLCHSCPSSLRRRKRPTRIAKYEPSCDIETSDYPGMNDRTFRNCQQGSCDMMRHDPLTQARGFNILLDNDVVYKQCPCLASGRSCAAAPFNSRADCLNCNKIYSSVPRAQQSQHYCYAHHVHAQNSHACHAKGCDDCGFRGEPFPLSATQADRVSLHSVPNAFRPHSSQSNRSSLHCGLYDSDSEGDIDQIADSHCLTDSEHAYFSNHHNLRECRRREFKPVLGYDRTLARVSRTRSKSQPPRIDIEESAHLTKSVENVEKLIKEVQNELNVLKRHPLESVLVNSRRTRLSGASRAAFDCLNGSEYDSHARVAEISDGQGDGTCHKLDSSAARPTTAPTSATRRAGQFKCIGAIRKAGFLSVKKWILKRRQSIELARKQGWKRYWVCLRGTSLLFHSIIDRETDAAAPSSDNVDQTNLLTWIQANCNNQGQVLADYYQSEKNLRKDGGEFLHEDFMQNIKQCYIEKEPKHLIIIDGAISQPIPEHPRRDFVFCLSTTFGDAYLFQASCQSESDNWISAMHNACAASLARDLTRDEAIKLFETKIRRLELEAEKKLFLRHRLESRLTSMSSMSNISKIITGSSNADAEKCSTGNDRSNNKSTMRSLLQRLSQQLLALDTYIEQVYCEVYQLRCYLSSCGVKQGNLNQQSTEIKIICELPHPKSLLIHVSRPTKLLLIKLGVFTVSSFHAYIHARSESAETIMQKIQQSSSCPSSPLELKIRSHPISELLLAKGENAELEDDTEELIQLANLKAVSFRINKLLYLKILRKEAGDGEQNSDILADTSDDRYSLRDGGETIYVSLKLNTSSNISSIIRQVLKIINPDVTDLEFLNYYLLITIIAKPIEDQTKSFVARRRETLCDWSDLAYVELLEKSIFRLDIAKSRLDEESAFPFGISVEGELITTKNNSLLNVFCSFIEWGSAADKAGLNDEDEIITLNGIPICDLDMMFVECLIREATKLKIIIRSSRESNPVGAIPLDRFNMKPTGGGGEGKDDEDYYTNLKSLQPHDNTLGPGYGPSQIMSDEYITSLVCPRPPTQSAAFLRTESGLMRQKSDLIKSSVVGYDTRLSESATTKNLLVDGQSVVKSKSQHRLDNSAVDSTNDYSTNTVIKSNLSFNGPGQISSLQERTERYKQPIDTAIINQVTDEDSSHNSALRSESRSDQNIIERLKKTISELLETEYAYIKHLETISDHYMMPLEGMNFLDITDLRLLNQATVDLIKFHQSFFRQLTSGNCIEAQSDSSEIEVSFDRLGKLMQKLESYNSIDEFKLLIITLTQTFLLEAEKFKVYANYCIVYSKLQRILHPKGSNMPKSTISSTAVALDVFSTSTALSINASQQHRDLSRSLGRTASNLFNDSDQHLKQLVDFLSNLDSSSSSISSSLAKSINSEHSQAENKSNRTSKSSQISMPSSVNQLQKNVHQQNFESYLIKPIQRIVKYPLLLNSIAISAQIYADEPFFENLQRAIKLMESVICHVNDTQRIQDEYGLVFENIERLYSEQMALDHSRHYPSPQFGPHRTSISVNINHLLCYGAVNWLNMREFAPKVKRGLDLNEVVFVFTSCVVFICKERVRSNKKKGNNGNVPNQESAITFSLNQKTTSKSTGNSSEIHEVIRYQNLIPVSEVQVRSAQHEQTKQNSAPGFYRWELFQCSSSNSNSNLLTKKLTSNQRANGKVYLLESPTNEERNLFLRKIRLIIRDSVRNMSLPLARSPSTKSSTSKKFFSSSTSSNTNTNSSCSQSTSLSPNLNHHPIEAHNAPGKPEWD